MKTKWLFLGMLLISLFSGCNQDDFSPEKVDNLPNITGYPIVGTNQSTAYDNTTIISKPTASQEFFGQNANYPGTTPKYVNNGDGTVTDMITGLMWQNTLDHNGDGLINYSDKLTYDEILAMVDTVTTGGHTDWRVPSIKEQYSLMNFNGKDISGQEILSSDMVPFINTEYFGFSYGDTDAGERLIDVQCASTNVSVGNIMQMVFGVNFADGRIKGYGTTMMGQPKVFNYLLVRGNLTYGTNSFQDNSDKTITDNATGLMWMQDDSGIGMNWKDALSYAENFTFAGKSDWRLPDVKELQSIVDYSRSPQTTASAAIDPLFNSTKITNEAGEDDYPFYWSSTTHASMASGNEGGWGAYVCFGRALGNESIPIGPGEGGMPPDGGTPPDGTLPPDSGTPPDGALPGSGSINWTDVHGAGAQRSDPKVGDPAEYPTGHGPQGDAVRILNYVRLVRNN